MKRKKILLSMLCIVALALELLPYSVVLNFANPEGEPWRKTFSYFDMTPFGYANFGPFLTAVLTCALLVFLFIGYFKFGRGINTAIRNISGVAIVTSLLPLIFGLRYVTVIGIIITVLLTLIFGVTFIKEK